MPMNRPTGRQRNITGQGKAIGRRGSGLGTGPVGSPRPGQSGGHSSHRGTGGTRSGGGGIKLILILLALLLGGGGAGGFLLGGSGDTPTNEGYTQVEQQGSSGNILSMLGNLGGGSVSSGWDYGSNAGKLDTSVAPGSREKYTDILGGGRDEITLMVYLCGTDLESKHKMASMDLQEMINADLSHNINILASHHPSSQVSCPV